MIIPVRIMRQQTRNQAEALYKSNSEPHCAILPAMSLTDHKTTQILKHSVPETRQNLQTSQQAKKIILDGSKVQTKPRLIKNKDSQTPRV